MRYICNRSCVYKVVTTYYDKRMNIFTTINIIAFVIFGIIGLTFAIKNRKDFNGLIQLQINRQTMTGFTIMMFISGLIMAIAFAINMEMGLLEIESRKNAFILIKNIPSELINAVGEEFMIRAFVFIGILVVLDNKLFALILSSIIFCFLHNPDSIISIISYFLAGLMYGVAFLGLRSIWAPIGLHFGWNYFQGIVFGFPVSSQVSDGYLLLVIEDNAIWNGGSTGPEGSILGIVGRLLIITSIGLITYVFSKKISSKQFLKLSNKW
ncbi:MAG: hypothetical protein B6I18_06230 [Bacteroidetes bacterium 4572_112]|nr:MAG: hypothetical protein B6I18_06230 [Bacteroidetes bacterium 4572_112]